MAHWSKGMGPNFVPAYQISGIPYVTSSILSEVGTTPIKVTFPQVTRFFVVQNISENPLRVRFTSNGVNAAETANYLVLSGNQATGRLELRCKELYFRREGGTNCGFSVLAGLSGVASNQFPTLTSSFLYSGSDGEPLPQPIPKFEGVG